MTEDLGQPSVTTEQPAPVDVPIMNPVEERPPGKRESCPDSPVPVGERAKIAILGTTPSRMQAPIGDPEWEIWTIGPGGMDAHNWDVLWEVHHVWPEDFAGYLNTLSKIQLPQTVVTLEPAPERIQRWAATHAGNDPKKRDELLSQITGDWASNRVVPKAELWENFRRRMWFSSSISYCIAMAMSRLGPLVAEGRNPTIGCWGIDLESGEEYIAQFTGAAHLLDLAVHFGIDVQMPEGCGLARDVAAYPERYETFFALETEKKQKWLQGMIPQVEWQLEDIKANYYRQEGAIQNMRDMGAADDLIQKANENYAALSMRLGQVNNNLQTLRGELSATEHWRKMFVYEMRDGFRE